MDELLEPGVPLSVSGKKRASTFAAAFYLPRRHGGIVLTRPPSSTWTAGSAGNFGRSAFWNGIYGNRRMRSVRVANAIIRNMVSQLCARDFFVPLLSRTDIIASYTSEI